MPKKMGVNSKAEAARARKNEAETTRKHQEARAKEEQYWQEAEGPKSRAAKKREEDSEKRAEAAARKAEARRLAEQEERELAKIAAKKSDKKANRVGIPVKMTEVELRRRREDEVAEMAKKVEERERKEKRVAGEEEYEKIVSVSNTNREENLIEAR